MRRLDRNLDALASAHKLRLAFAAWHDLHDALGHAHLRVALPVDVYRELRADHEHARRARLDRHVLLTTALRMKRHFDATLRQRQAQLFATQALEAHARIGRDIHTTLLECDFDAAVLTTLQHLALGQET